jgi:hypothetical protein
VTSLIFENDLGEGHRGEIVAGGGVDHRDLLAGPDHLLQLFERDVPALLGVVELAVRVPLDDVGHALSPDPAGV